MMVLLACLGMASATDLSALQGAFQRFPEDYASAVALGDAALAAGNGVLAVEAYERAVELSSGNFESRKGAVLALTMVGEHDAAVEAARALTTDFPELPGAWSTRAWAHRWRPTFPQMSAALAARSYQRALSLGGADDLRCGLGWSRWALGDATGAHRAFADSGSPCRSAGLAATPQGPSVVGAVLGGGTGYTGHSWRRSGTVAGLQVGAAWSSLASLDATVRRVGLSGELVSAESVADPVGMPTAPVAVSAQQNEVWLRGQTRGRTTGLQGLFGSVTTTGDVEDDAWFVGGRGWTQLAPVTLGASAISGTYSDGAHVQLGADLYVPLTPQFAVSGGVQFTQLTPTDSTAATTAGTSGWGAVRFTSTGRRFSGEVGGRAGAEVRPVRLADPSVWNIDDTMLYSGFANASWRIDDRFTLFFGGERLRLAASADPLAVAELESLESTVTTGHVGLRINLGPTPREEP